MSCSGPVMEDLSLRLVVGKKEEESFSRMKVLLLHPGLGSAWPG